MATTSALSSPAKGPVPLGGGGRLPSSVIGTLAAAASPLVYVVDAVRPPGNADPFADPASHKTGTHEGLGSAALAQLLQGHAHVEGRKMGLREVPPPPPPPPPPPAAAVEGSDGETGAAVAPPPPPPPPPPSVPPSEPRTFEVTLPAGPVRIKFRGSPAVITEISPDSPLHGQVQVGQIIERAIIPPPPPPPPDAGDEDEAELQARLGSVQFRRFLDVVGRTNWSEDGNNGGEGDDLSSTGHTAGTVDSLDPLSGVLSDDSSHGVGGTIAEDPEAEGADGGGGRSDATTPRAGGADGLASHPPPPPPTSTHPSGKPSPLSTRLSALRSSSPSIAVAGLQQRFSKTIGLRRSSDDDDMSGGGGSDSDKPFFARAEVVSVSRRHVFPPSKDPAGTHSRISRVLAKTGHSSTGGGVVHGVSAALAYSRSHGTAASHNGGDDDGDEDATVDGILPAGWAEKHSHALPSVLILVANADMFPPGADRERQDAHVVETLERLRSSLAPKRECRVQLVFVGGESGTTATTETGTGAAGEAAPTNEADRVAAIRTRLKLAASNVTVLRPSADIPPMSLSEADASATPLPPPTPTLRKLHRSVRDASAAYYLGQSRRAKRKHSLLPAAYERTRPDLLPLAARYAYKIGTFYELQGRSDRGARYFAESYRCVEKHYSRLLEDGAGANEDVNSPRAVHMQSSGGGSGASSGYDSGVEVSAVHEGGSDHGSSAPNTDDEGEEEEEEGVEVGLTGSPVKGPRHHDDEDEEDGIQPGGTIAALPPPPSPGVVAIIPPPPPPPTVDVAASEEDSRLSAEEADAVLADALHQCRTVAAVLHLKLLRTAFAAAAAAGDTRDSAAVVEKKAKSSSSSSVEGGGPEGEGGYVTAAQQWRRHRLVYSSHATLAASAATSTTSSSEEARKRLDVLPHWHRLSYASREALTAARLCERNVPRRDALGGLTGPLAETLLTVSAWRRWAEAAEAAARLGKEVERERTTRGGGKGGDDDYGEGRHRGAGIGGQMFVGGLGGDSLDDEFDEEAARDHRALALECAEHAIAVLREEDRSSGGETNGHPTKNARAEARLRYLAGGVLFSLGRYAEAADHLDRVVNGGGAGGSGPKWPGVEVAARRALLRCLEKIPTPSAIGEGRAADSPSCSPAADVALELILSSDSSRLLSRAELEESSRLAFGLLAVGSGAADVAEKAVKWPSPEERSAAASAALPAPFDFAVTFPGTTHATNGDDATASVSVKSNLRVPVALGGIRISTAAGDVDMPASAFLGDDGEGAGSGVVVLEPGSARFWSVRIPLPSKIEAAAHRRRAEPKPKPKTAGMTRAAGALYVRPADVEEPSREGEGGGAAKPTAAAVAGSAGAPRLFGGTPVGCLGMELKLLHPDVAAGGRAVSLSLVDRRRETVAVPGSPKSPARTSKAGRTPIEEDNYVLSAWERPGHHPLVLGPRCLRVHGPLPALEVSDLTAAATQSKAMEGTVHRIVLKIRAGEGEICRDARYSVTCSSALSFSEAGEGLSAPKSSTSKSSSPSKTPDRKDADGGGGKPPKRAPMLVVGDDDRGGDAFVTEEGYELPRGWKPRGGDAGRGSTDDLAPVVAPSGDLDPGCEAYLAFDLFRPLPLLPTIGGSRTEGGGSGGGDMSCWTSFSVSITYKQTRFNQSGGGADGGAQSADVVTKEFKGSVVWRPPLTATFSVVTGPQKHYPSGSRHPSNLISKGLGSSPSSKPSFLGADALRSNSIAGAGEAAAVDGESVRVRCALEAEEAGDGLAAEVQGVSFESLDDEKNSDGELECELTLVSDDPSVASEGALFKKDPGDAAHTNVLRKGSKFGLSYSIRAKLSGGTADIQSEDEGAYVRTSLGVLVVDFVPVRLELPPDAFEALKQSPAEEGGDTDPLRFAHGPLPLRQPSTAKFLGPLCYIESAPFHAVLSSFPAAPQVAVPFEVKYRITNKTSLHQKLEVSMSEAGVGGAAENQQSAGAEGSGVLVSGLVNGEIRLAPLESRTLTYSALAIRAGRTPLPALTVASARHKAWVINDGPSNPRFAYVLP